MNALRLMLVILRRRVGKGHFLGNRGVGTMDVRYEKIYTHRLNGVLELRCVYDEEITMADLGSLDGHFKGLVHIQS